MRQAKIGKNNTNRFKANLQQQYNLEFQQYKEDDKKEKQTSQHAR